MTTASTELPEVTVEITSDANSITELFSREPDSWTEKDMVALVAHLRKMRGEFKEAEAKGKTPKAPKAPKEKLEAASGADLLSKLGL